MVRGRSDRVSSDLDDLFRVPAHGLPCAEEGCPEFQHAPGGPGRRLSGGRSSSSSPSRSRRRQGPGPARRSFALNRSLTRRTISTFSCDIAYSAQPGGFEGLLPPKEAANADDLAVARPGSGRRTLGRARRGWCLPSVGRVPATQSSPPDREARFPRRETPPKPPKPQRIRWRRRHGLGTRAVPRRQDPRAPIRSRDRISGSWLPGPAG